MRTILLDMDGVVSDFVGGTFKLFGAEYPNPWPKGVYEFSEVLGITQSRAWQEIDKHGEEFWSELNELPLSKELYQELSSIGEVYFCTSPSQNPASLSGKLKWLKRFTGNNGFRKYVITPQKHLLARNGAILIDDYDRNIELFRNANEFAGTVLFPQDWNSNHDFKGRNVFYTIEKVVEYFTERNR